MVPKKSNTRALPKAGASNLSNSSLTNIQSQKSAILKHAFAPSQLRLNLFASVVQGLEAHVLRVHDTLSGKLTSEYDLHAGKVSCLRWGTYYSADDRPTKKRKTKTGAETQQGDVVIGIGFSNDPRIELYSPARGKTVATLVDAHSQGVQDICFARSDSRKAWSIGKDGKLAEWNLTDGSCTEVVTLSPPVSSSNILQEASGTIFAAHTSIYTLETSSPNDFETYSGFSSPIHSLILDVASDNDEPTAILGASEDESGVLVLDLKTQRIRGTLLSTSSVESVAVAQITNKRTPFLAAVNKHGLVDLFSGPFQFDQNADKKSAKERSKSKTKKPVGSVQIVRPGSSETVPITGVSFDGDDLVIGWVEGGATPVFHRLPWRDAGGKAVIDGPVRLEKSKSQSGLANAKMNGVDTIKAQVDDSRTVIVRGDGIESMDVDGPDNIDISDEDGGSETSADEMDAPAKAKTLTNGVHSTDDDMDDADADAADDAEEDADQEPSFGDLLRAKAPEPVDVSSAFASKAQTALVPQGEKSLSLPSGMSLGTVLAQALRTNDRALLETCFHVQELNIIRATIRRLDSTLAGSLLERLAERFHNRPGRAGSLQIWMQETLVAHGGYLAGQPKVVKQLRELHEVVKERAQSLSALLMLKGKLDLLDAQMNLRKANQQQTRMLQAAREEEEEDAIYVEGQEEEDSDEEGAAPAPEDIEFDSDEEVETDTMPTTMEVDEDGEDEDEEEGDDLIDDEAEETEDDEGSDDEIDHDDVDSADELDDDSEADAFPKFKHERKVNGVAKRR